MGSKDGMKSNGERVESSGKNGLDRRVWKALFADLCHPRGKEEEQEARTARRIIK
uniref:Uncharacterized protein n=1 Tax=Arion vulgaris TaxID=1028688 RepID=A0A0B7AMR7_9EUPU